MNKQIYVQLYLELSFLRNARSSLCLIMLYTCMKRVHINAMQAESLK